MKAFVERDMLSRTLRIWLLQSELGRMRSHVVRFVDSETRELVEASSGEQIEPTLILHEEEAEALVRALTDVLPASDATVEHLKDARETRDRLLVLVEHVVKPEPPA